MDLPPEFVLTGTVAALREFPLRPGVRHAFLVGAPGTGKTAALQYLANSLQADNHLVVMVQLREVETADQLFVHVARAVLDAIPEQADSPPVDPLDQIRGLFADRFTSSQRREESDRFLWKCEAVGDYRRMD